MENYEVLGVIGKGNFGSISRIKRKSDNKILVWKELDYGKMSEKEKQHIVSEVNILRDLKHPNIVRYYDRIIDKKNTKIFIIMEYCEGGDIGALIKRCRKNKDYIAEDVIWKIFTQIVLALHECHTRKEGKILHRDMKPSNVFLDSENNVKLGDFGLSRILSNESTFAYSHVGTPYYMSPEQIDEIKYNEKSDIWSLGCFLYELASLNPPFEATNHLSLALKIKSGKIERIPTRYSEELNRVIQWTMVVDHTKRPSVEDLLNLPQVSLRLRERRLKDNMTKLKKYEDSLKQKETELCEKEKEVENREKILLEKEEKFKELEKKLFEKEKNINLYTSGHISGSNNINNNIISNTSTSIQFSSLKKTNSLSNFNNKEETNYSTQNSNNKNTVEDYELFSERLKNNDMMFSGYKITSDNSEDYLNLNNHHNTINVNNYLNMNKNNSEFRESRNSLNTPNLNNKVSGEFINSNTGNNNSNYSSQEYNNFKFDPSLYKENLNTIAYNYDNNNNKYNYSDKPSKKEEIKTNNSSNIKSGTNSTSKLTKVNSLTSNIPSSNKNYHTSKEKDSIHNYNSHTPQSNKSSDNKMSYPKYNTLLSKERSVSPATHNIYNNNNTNTYTNTYTNLNNSKKSLKIPK